MAKLMRISRQPHPSIMTDQNKLDTVEQLGSMITSDARCTRDIEARIAKSKAAYDQEKKLFASKVHLNLRWNLVKCKFWSTGFVWC
jgi:hypothetical protein